jgi:hypothetical protein
MATFQCLFFSNGKIGYWENIECDAEESLRSLLQHILCDGEWDTVEAWTASKLVCRLERPSDGPSEPCPNGQALSARGD